MFEYTDVKDLVEEVRGLPGNPIGENRFNRALGYWDSRHIQLSRTWFELTLQENPDLGEAHIYLGNIFVYKNKLREAIKEYDKAEKVDYLKQVAQINKVVVYAALKEFKLAKRILDGLLKRHSNDSAVLAVAGFFNLQAGDYDVSISFLEKSILSGIVKKAPYIDLTYLYSVYLRDFDKTIEFASRPSLPLTVKDEPLFLNNLAYGLIKLGKIEDAENILKQIDKGDWLKDIDPNVPCAILATKGLLNIYKGEIDEGNKLYKKAEGMAPVDKKALIEQKRLVENGYYYLQRDQFVDAEREFKHALQIKTPVGILNFSSEALGYLEKNYQLNKSKEFTNSYIRCTNEGIAIDVPIDKIPILLDFLNNNLVSNTVSITFKENGQYRIKKFLKKKWSIETRDLLYYFLLPSTLIEWKNNDLYSNGYGYYFLELTDSPVSLKEKIFGELKDKLQIA